MTPRIYYPAPISPLEAAGGKNLKADVSGSGSAAFKSPVTVTVI